MEGALYFICPTLMSNHISAVVDRKEYWLPQVIHYRAACATRTGELVKVTR